MNPEKVVTRFAPSPTGFMHIGGVRTAIYAWLFARKHAGKFILRIEDTDKEREVEGSIEHIIETLQWLGLDWDEGPYLQSQRLDSYKRYAYILIEKGFAYPDPYTEEEVEFFRKQAEVEKRPFLYRDYRPEIKDTWDGKKPLRFRVPEIKRYEWPDMARGLLSAGEEALDDFILIKSDGYPTYNFAHIVDDLEMGVTHIIRGEEFISSTPRFLSLYEALGVERPHIATVPIILGPDGNKKLSKRDGAKDVLDYRIEGYLPETMVNFLALLGWHPEGEQEIMTVDELIGTFNISRLQKGGAKFDETKLRWFNHEHIKRLAREEFEARLRAFMELHKEQAPAYLFDIADELKARAQTLGEAAELIRTGEFNFMEEEISYDPHLLIQGAKVDIEHVKKNLTTTLDMISKINTEVFSAEKVKEAVFPYATEQGRASVLWPLRIALSGREKSLDPFLLAGLIGKERVLARIEYALESL
jgi:glutamyl-tRNA synthetase